MDATSALSASNAHSAHPMIRVGLCYDYVMASVHVLLAASLFERRRVATWVVQAGYGMITLRQGYMCCVQHLLLDGSMDAASKHDEEGQVRNHVSCARLSKYHK